MLCKREVTVMWCNRGILESDPRRTVVSDGTLDALDALDRQTAMATALTDQRAPFLSSRREEGRERPRSRRADKSPAAKRNVLHCIRCTSRSSLPQDGCGSPSPLLYIYIVSVRVARRRAPPPTKLRTPRCLPWPTERLAARDRRTHTQTRTLRPTLTTATHPSPPNHDDAAAAALHRRVQRSPRPHGGPR